MITFNAKPGFSHFLMFEVANGTECVVHAVHNCDCFCSENLPCLNVCAMGLTSFKNSKQQNFNACK